MPCEPLATDNPRQAVWVHGSRNLQVHAFRERVADLATRFENIEQHIFYDTQTSS